MASALIVVFFYILYSSSLWYIGYLDIYAVIYSLVVKLKLLTDRWEVLTFSCAL